MPKQCPINKLGVADCLLCSNNREGYCWALCPPKECKRPINEILTLDERLTILEVRLDTHKDLDSEVEQIIDLENRLVSLEDLSYKLEKRIQTFFEVESKYNAMYDTINNTLSKFSKEILSLKESLSKSNGTKYNTKYKEYN